MSIEEWADADLNCRIGPNSARLRSERREIYNYIRDSWVYRNIGDRGLRSNHVKELIDQYAVESSTQRGCTIGSDCTLDGLKVRMVKDNHTVNKPTTWENGKTIQVTSHESILINRYQYPRLVFTYMVDEKRLVITRRTEERQ